MGKTRTGGDERQQIVVTLWQGGGQENSDTGRAGKYKNILCILQEDQRFCAYSTLLKQLRNTFNLRASYISSPFLPKLNFKLVFLQDL